MGLTADKTLQNYTAIVKHDSCISVCFYIEHEKPFAISEKMHKTNREAYMSGYNGEAFIIFLVRKRIC